MELWESVLGLPDEDLYLEIEIVVGVESVLFVCTTANKKSG